MSLPNEPLTQPVITVYGIYSPIEEIPIGEPLNLTQTHLLCQIMEETKQSLELPFGSSLTCLPLNGVIGVHLAHALMKPTLILKYGNFSEKTKLSFITAIERLIDHQINQIIVKRQKYLLNHQNQHGFSLQLSPIDRSQIKAIIQRFATIACGLPEHFRSDYFEQLQLIEANFHQASRDLPYLSEDHWSDSTAISIEYPRDFPHPSKKIFWRLMDNLSHDWNQFVDRLSFPHQSTYYLSRRS